MSLGPDCDDFSRVLSISGGEVDAQATTCCSYIQEHFTAVKGVLPALQAAWNSGSLYETSLDLGGIHHGCMEEIKRGLLSSPLVH